MPRNLVLVAAPMAIASDGFALGDRVAAWAACL